MDDVSILAQTDVCLALERSENIITIRSANLALEMARKEGRPDDIAMVLIQLAHLH